MTDRKTLQGFDVGDKCAAVVGCGGLGCHIATHLVCAGVGKLIVIDADEVSESNLNRQFLFTVNDIGRKKVFLAAGRLQAICPECEIVPVDKRVSTPADLEIAGGADILFSAVDNNAARSVLERFCRERGIPLVNGGVNGFFGSAYLYVPGRTPDLSAAGMLERENGRTVSVSSTVGLIGALEAQLGLCYLTGSPATTPGALYVLDGGEIRTMKIGDESR